MDAHNPNDFSLPSPELLARQAEWLQPARSRLFRRIQIAHRQSTLDLGCGWHTVTPELVRRSNGNVVAADCSRHVFAKPAEEEAAFQRVCCNAAHLPFQSETFDLVFCQFALLWFGTEVAINEIRRVLTPGGVLIAIEPDYGGLIEYPNNIATRELWESALHRAGADPHIGRRLPAILAENGFEVRVNLLDQLTPPSPLRFDLLRGLPLTDAETSQLDRIITADATCPPQQRVVHLPIFLITASI